MGSIPKAKKKNIPKSIHEMSKEMLQETLKKKKECNAKALMIVEKLCEINVDEEWFLENLQFINQCHFDDATVERAITKICGYPLCDQKLDNIPAQQYHISTKYNKVFDITERKNFCSSVCYKSANFVKKQLFTSPLWFRDQEVIPKYKIAREEESSLGKEIAISPEKITLEPNDRQSRNDAIIRSVNELVDECKNLKLENSEEVLKNKTEDEIEESSNNPAKNNFNKKLNSEENKRDENLKLSKSGKSVVENKSIDSSNNSRLKKANEIKATVKVKEELIDTVQNKSEIKKTVKVKRETVDVVTKIENCVFEWFSLDTLFYLYGEEKLKEIFNDKADKVKEIINSKLSVAGYNEKIDKIIKLYGLLDNDFLTKGEIKTNLKPLPDYSVLKEEGKTLEIKVKAFYQGQLEVKPIENKSIKNEEETKTNSEPIYLPLIDAHAQTALRRKIVLDKLNRVLPELVRIFSSSYILQMNEVRNLVSTFSLAAHNIVFKPREWYLIGIIIIKLLSLKDKQLQLLINSKSSESQILLILSSYQLKSDYLEDLLHRLTDSSDMIEKFTDINK